MDFITQKSVKIFDMEKINVGSFITYCRIQKGYSDDGEISDSELEPSNGIITGVEEDKIYLLDKKGESLLLQLDLLLMDYPPYKVLGIRENAL